MDLTALEDALSSVQEDDLLPREQVNRIRRALRSDERPLVPEDMCLVPIDSQIGRILTSDERIVREIESEMREYRAKVLESVRETKGIRSTTKKRP